MNKNIIFGLILVSVTPNLYALESDLALYLGYDDNPYKLSDDFDPDGGWFLDTILKAQHKYENFRFRGNLKHRTYENSLDDADNTSMAVDARYRKKHEIAGKRAYSSVLLKYGIRDKTYVSRTTGMIGTSGGQEIRDRYDYKYWAAKAKTSIKITKPLKVELELDYLDKDYDHPSVSGLSNLDYRQLELSNDWKYAYSDTSRFGLTLSASRREYDNKRSKNLLGLSVPGTDLTYNYGSISVSHRYDFTSKLQSKIKYEYEERSDNGSGYYDYDSHKGSAALRYMVKDGLTLKASLLYQKLEYDYAIVVDENDDPLPGKDGYTAKLRLQKDLELSKTTPAYLFAEVKYDTYDSNTPVYEYDRAQALIGVNINFGGSN